MANKYFLFALVFLFSINLILACIDINTASLSELDELSGIGPVYAQNIIDTRPYETLDDLIKVYGIGPVTLQKIKDQGLACVDGETDDSDTDDDEDNSNEDENNEITVYQTRENNEQKKETQTISLNPKDINSEKDTQKIFENNYALYGLGIFSIFILLLFLLRKKDQNEFE